MLSHRLEALASHFAAWASRPEPLSLDQRLAALIADQLADAADAARALEGQPVPPHAAAGPLPAGVASLAEARARRAA